MSDYCRDCISVFGFGDPEIAIVAGSAMLLTPPLMGCDYNESVDGVFVPVIGEFVAAM